MRSTTYPEDQLVTNGAPVLLHGSTEAERRAWAEECSGTLGATLHVFKEGGVASLLPLLSSPRTVLFMPDVASVGEDVQRSLVNVLRERDERPKIILGLVGALSTASADGRLRDDLAYAVRRGHLNLAQPEVRNVIAERREKSPPPPPVLPAKAQIAKPGSTRKRLR